MKFHIHVENINLEGTVSQIFYIGPSFYFMRSRKIIMEKKNLPVLFYIITKLGPILKF